MFSILTRYQPELFQPSYLEDLLFTLRKKGYPANGFFAGCETKLEDNKLTITLQHGGYEMLRQSGCDSAMNHLILEEFGRSVEIAFDGVLSLDADSPQYQEAMNTAPKPEIVIPREDKPKKEKKEAEPKRLGFDCEGLPFVENSAIVVMGKPIKERPISLNDVTQESGKVTVWGDIVRKESVTSKDGKWEIYSIDITDYENSNTLKVIMASDKKEAIDELKLGNTILVQGDAAFDKYEHDVTIRPNSITLVSKVKKKDNAPKKRVELHLHTNMSSMDGMSSPKDLVNTAHNWGHTAIAITDHGVCQGFPDAMYLSEGWKDFKMIYGVEAYFVDDMIMAVKGEAQRDFDGEYIIFDLETTGLSPSNERITEIGAVKIRNSAVVDTFNTFVNPQKAIPPKIVEPDRHHRRHGPQCSKRAGGYRHVAGILLRRRGSGCPQCGVRYQLPTAGVPPLRRRIPQYIRRYPCHGKIHVPKPEKPQAGHRCRVSEGGRFQPPPGLRRC